jgi:tetratricopeptide (TPR) repeat protein
MKWKLLNRREFRAAAIKAATLVMVTLLAYVPAIEAGFIWNDHDLTANLVFQKNGLFRVWFTTESVNYWPLVWTSYWFEHQLWGFHPMGYHVVNILLHVAGSLLIWRILKRLAVPGAWFAALLFALHPVNVESVAWVTQRKNVLCLLFFAASVLSFLRHDDQHGRGVGWATVVWFVLAMLSKGAAAPLPVVLMLCIWWRRGGTPSGPLLDDVSRRDDSQAITSSLDKSAGSRTILSAFARDVLRVLPCFAVALVMSGIEIWFQYVRAIGDEVVRDDSIFDRLAGAGWVVWFYLGKAIYPANLTFVYPRWEIDARSWEAHIPNLALILILLLAWRFRRSWGRPLLFALVYFLVMLAPVLGFFDIYFMLYSFVADHYQYLAIIGPISLFAAAGTTGLSRANAFLRGALRVAAVVLPVYLGFLTWQQSQIYHDKFTLWRDTLRKNPEAWLAHHNLAKLLADRGELAEAAGHFLQVLRIHPVDAWAHNELGLVRQAQGRYDFAASHFRQAIAIAPTLPEAHYNLGALAQQLGNLDEAILHYQEAIDIRPGFASAHNNLGTAFEIQGRTAQAIEHYQEALKWEPGNAQARANLSRLLSRDGEPGSP